MPSPILKQMNLPNALTLTGLMLSFLSVGFAVKGQFYTAVLLMIWAGITDLFDGFVARKTKRTALQAEVGKQLDSLVDVCSFGFAPAVFLYIYGLQAAWLLPVGMAFIGAAALRLAYFNSTGLDNEGDAQYFTGMPVTYNALFIPLVFSASFMLGGPTMRGVLVGLYLLLAAAMVGNFRLRKPRGIWYLIFAGMAVALSGVYLSAIVRA